MNFESKLLKLVPAILIIFCIVLLTNQLFISCGASKGFINYAEEVEDRYRWGNVPDSILAREECPYDSTAAAMTLLDIGDITISSKDYNATYLVHKRIQIFKEEGKEYANIRIPYWHESIISSIKAQVILPSGETKSVKSGDIKEEGEEEGRKYKVFTIPNVKENCVIEYQYKKINENLSIFEPWEFQNELYTKLSRLTIKIGAGFLYDSHLNNSPVENYKPKQNVVEANFSDEKFKAYTWEFEDLKPIKKEPYMTTVSDYKASLDFQLESYKDPTTHYELAKSWDDIADGFVNDYEEYLEPSDRVNKLANRIVGEGDSKEVKAQRLFKFVRDSITKEEEKYIETKSPEEIINSRSASGVGKNILLYSLMRSIGLNSKIMMISTRSHGEVDELNPRILAFNHSIVRLQIDNEKQYLDCSSKYYTYNLLPYENYTNSGLVIGENTAKFENLPGIRRENNFKARSSAELDKEGNLEAVSQVQYEGYPDLNSRENLDNSEDAEEFAKEYILDELDEITIDTVIINNRDSLNSPLSLEIKYSVSNFANVANNFIYLNPNLLCKREENPFELEEREFPVDYPYPHVNKELVSYEIPEEYSIVETPDQCNDVISGVRYERSFQTEGNRLKYKRIQEVYKMKILPRYYSNLKSFYGEMVNKDGHQVVLKKDN